jgi:methylmalonyl-CoA mutase
MSDTPIRVVTAASLFDGHDAAINIMRRLLQGEGAEVIHLGHDRSVDEIVEAAIQEDAQAVAVSSYQGGHMEFFGYRVDQLAARGAGHVRFYGGGGGTIVREEIEALHARGVARIFSPADGRRLGLLGMIRGILDECRATARVTAPHERVEELAYDAPGAIARLISFLENEGPVGGQDALRTRAVLEERARGRQVPVLGFTGTGGAGKSSVLDELVRRFRHATPSLRIGVVLVDPTRRRSGGALLGDRVRMNAIHSPSVFVRSLATRRAHLALSGAVRDATLVLRAAGFDLVFVETAGIGQSDSEIVDLTDASIYVMTPEYGAPSQLEKIDMLELADVVVLNKGDRRGAADALRDVRRQWRRNHPEAPADDETLPIFSTVASQWDDPGLDRLYAELAGRAGALGVSSRPRVPAAAPSVAPPPLIADGRERYLSDVVEAVRGYRTRTEAQARAAREAQGLAQAEAALADAREAAAAVRAKREARLAALEPALRSALESWPAERARYEAERQQYDVRGRAVEAENHVETLSGTRLPRVALPRGEDWGELARYLRSENLPGRFPFTAGVFPFKRPEEEPARMFAGEGPP